MEVPPATLDQSGVNCFLAVAIHRQAFSAAYGETLSQLLSSTATCWSGNSLEILSGTKLLNKRNVFLVGFMGTGKTTIGKELAKMMGRKFQDLDAELEKRLGQSVVDYFAEFGEAKFREAEERVAVELSTTNNRVIATGGGTILNPRIYEALDATGLLICLYTQRDDLVDRLKRNDKRPLVRGQSPEEIKVKVDQLLKERSEKYERVKIRIDTSDLTPMAAARKIFELVSLQTRILQGFEASIDLS